MGSSQLSKSTIDSITKLKPKPLTCFQKAKSFILIFFLVLPVRSLPITTDVVTDSLLLDDLHSEWTSTNSSKKKKRGSTDDASEFVL